MPREKTMRVGIVGCGRVTQGEHIPALIRIDGVEVAAICDKDKASMTMVGSRVRNARCYDDFSQMLSQEELDIVDICTPPQIHPAIAIKAAESGCHILMEKPAALTLAEFDRVAEACTRNGVKLCHIQNMMFTPFIIGLMSQVGKGDVGDVLGVDIHVLSRRQAILARDNPEHWYNRLPAGVFTEVAPHTIYLAQAFLGAIEPIGVYTGKADRKHPTHSDVLRVILDGERGVGIISWSGPATKDKIIIDITGTRKNVRVDLWNSVKFEYGMRGTSNAAKALENLEQCFSILACSAGAALSVILGRRHSGHFSLISSFVQSLREGKDPPVSIEQAREGVRVLEAITQMAAIDKAA